MVAFKCLRCGETYVIPSWIADDLSYKEKVYCNGCYRLKTSKNKPLIARFFTKRIDESPFNKS